MKTIIILAVILLFSNSTPDKSIVDFLKTDTYAMSDINNAISEIFYLQNDTSFYKNYLKNVKMAKGKVPYLKVDFTLIRYIKAQQFYNSLIKYEIKNSIKIPTKFKQPLEWFNKRKIKLTQVQIKEFLVEEYVVVPVFESVFYTLLLYDKSLLYKTIIKFNLKGKFNEFLDNPYPLCERDLPFNLRLRMKKDLIDFLKNDNDEHSRKIIKSLNEFEME